MALWGWRRDRIESVWEDYGYSFEKGTYQPSNNSKTIKEKETEKTGDGCLGYLVPGEETKTNADTLSSVNSMDGELLSTEQE